MEATVQEADPDFASMISKLINNGEGVVTQSNVEETDQTPNNINLVQIDDKYYVTDEHGNIRTDYQVHVQQPEGQSGEETENVIIVQGSYD